MTTLLYIPIFFGVSIEVYLILIVLGIPTFFIWRFLFKKFIKAERTRKIATWTATLITIPLIYAAIVMLWILSMSYYPTHDFDKEKWFSDKETRYELSEDIIESEMLIGRTKSEVRQILGNENNSDQSDHWSYYLGFRPGLFSIDPDVLNIEFRDGKVIRVQQHET